MIENNTLPTDQSLPAQGPGDRLQAARISIGLTIEDVANKMHLSESILSSLEENDFDDITAPIFVKGYLRSYARMVNVDENDIIQQYSSFYMDGDPPINSTSNTSPEINSGDTRVKWITWLVIVGLIALLSAWWWNRYQQPAQPLSLDGSEPIPQLADSPQKYSQTILQTDSESVAQQQNNEDLSLQAEADLAAMSTLQMENPTSIQEPGSIDQPIEIFQPDTVQQEETMPAPSTDEMSEDTGPPVDENTVSTPVDSTTADSMTDSDELTVNVNADTWTDIRDAEGNKLIYDLLRSGEKISVKGKKPISAFFGNGYGVSLQYQGKDVDLSKSIRADNTARVKIGQ